MIFKYVIKKSETVKSFLQRHDYSKKTISAIKHNGALLVNGHPVTVRKEMTVGDQFEVHMPIEEPSSNLLPYPKPLDIVFEDEFILIVNKPQSQNCAPSREHPHESLVEQVLAYLMNKDVQTNPHIVTRLDRNTSGLVLFAKFGHIHHLFSKVKFEKEYICLAYGRTQPEGVVEAPIARDSDSIITRKVSDKGKYAKTSYYTIVQNNTLSLCKVKLHTGRTHQIRVHFQFMGHPIVGDDLYGGVHHLVKGQSLQCCSLKFVHPINHNKISINIDYKQLIQLLNVL